MTESRWVFPVSKSQLDAAEFLSKLNPRRYQLNKYHYLEGMCIHWDCKDLVTGETLMPETVHTYFGRPAWLEPQNEVSVEKQASTATSH